MILLADREYIGEKWFKYLKNNGLEFVIRLKKNNYKEYVDAQRQGNSKSFSHQKWRHIGMEKEAYKQKYSKVGVAKKIKMDAHRLNWFGG